MNNQNTSVRKTLKTLEEMNLLDRFLFAEAMENIENLEILLQIILDQPNLKLMEKPRTERELRTRPENRMVRMDVWGEGKDRTVYDAEPQQKNTNNLPKRSRYYQSLMDYNLLDIGEMDFNKLPNSYIITIMPFDLFGLKYYQYTFKSFCQENKNLEIGDNATRIFLNTKGTNNEETRPELIALLKYIEHTTQKYADQSNSHRIKRLHENIKKPKKSKEVNLKLMQAWEERKMEIEEGIEEGLRQATAQIQAERDRVASERDKVISERDRVVSQRDKLAKDYVNGVISTAKRCGASMETAINLAMEQCSISQEQAAEAAGRIYQTE